MTSVWHTGNYFALTGYSILSALATFGITYKLKSDFVSKREFLLFGIFYPAYLVRTETDIYRMNRILTQS